MNLTLAKKLTTALLLLSAQLNAQSSHQTDHSYDSGVGDRSVTIGLLSGLSGYLPVYYEKAEDSKMSFQYGAGITFHSLKNDFGNGWLSIVDENNDFSNYSHRSAIPGLYLSFAPRFYRRGKCMNGFFYSPMIAFANYNYLAKMDPEYKDYSSGNHHEYRNTLDLKFYIGHHIQSKNGVAFEWNVGLGLWMETTHRVYLFENSVTRNGMIDQTFVLPSISLNLALGKGF